MRRLDWINATYSEFGQTFIDHTTLFKFYQQLADDEATYQLFVDLTNNFIKTCGVSTKRQRVDSFFMLGWLATLSREHGRQNDAAFHHPPAAGSPG